MGMVSGYIRKPGRGKIAQKPPKPGAAPKPLGAPKLPKLPNLKPKAKGFCKGGKV